MNTSELFEATMLICFSISWYWSIAKMLSTRTAAGKSLFFVALICTGYSFGIVSKLLIWQHSGQLSPLLWLYCWNLLVTSFDAVLVLRFNKPRMASARTAMDQNVSAEAIAAVR